MRSKRVISIALVLLFSVAMVLSPCIIVKADSFPSEFYVNSDIYYSAEELGVAYFNLDLEQQDIANYLMGMYNLFYLGARGFQIKKGTYSSSSTFIAKIKQYGYRILYGAVDISMYSRFNSDFCRFASAVILYASQCNVTFDTWFENLDDDFVIPIDQGIINSFTLMYNDNSDLGIATYGDVQSPWESGTYVDFGFNNLTWGNSSSQENFNYFIDRPPYLFSNVSAHVNYFRDYAQLVVCSAGDLFPDTLFILRSDFGYSSYVYGYTTVVNGNVNRYRVTNEKFVPGTAQTTGNKIYFSKSDVMAFANSIYNAPNNSDLSDFIDYVFYNSSPLRNFYLNYNGANCNFNGCYPLITHVVLVDNLTSLSNQEEIFNTDSWDVISQPGNMIVPIDKVNIKPKMITTINLPDNTTNNVDIKDIIDDQGDVVDDSDNPVNPWQVTVVVQPNNTNPISVDVNMFNGGTSYIDYLWGHTMKMAQYAKDLLDCFDFTADGGESYGPKFAIYGVLVLGIAGGLVAKFLL